MTIDAAVVGRRLDSVRQQVADAGGDPGRVEILAVTKGFGPDAVQAAMGAGLRAVGENYAQELLDKAGSLDDQPEWHFIGRLQSNKVRLVADRVRCWQSVDRGSLVDEIARRAPGARVMIQVNATGEDQKGGADPPEAPALVARARDAGLHVEGLMSVGVLGDASATERAFRDVVTMAEELGLPERSLGMTGDLAAAVRAGTTMIRIGTGLFGPRG